MTSGELDLTFSAAVSVSTLDPKEITLQSAQALPHKYQVVPPDMLEHGEYERGRRGCSDHRF